MKSLILPEELRSADEDPVYECDGPRSMQKRSLLSSQRKGKFPKLKALFPCVILSCENPELQKQATSEPNTSMGTSQRLNPLPFSQRGATRALTTSMGWADLLVEAITTVNFAADGSQNPTTGLGALEHMDMRTFISIRQDRRYPARESLLYLDEERHCARSYP
ncbi:hypothetical protein XANCAGTX0491_003849 [Xanthoria calcicola]